MFTTNRPKIAVPLTPFDIIIECCSIALLIFIWAHLIMAYPNLPEVVPSHFNAAGEADGFSNKTFLFLLPSVITGIYILLLVLTRFPHLHNYMVNITEDNAPRQYRFGITVLRVVNFLCVLMFAYINYSILVGAQNSTSDLGNGFLFVVIGFSIVLPIGILIYQNRLK